MKIWDVSHLLFVDCLHGMGDCVSVLVDIKNGIVLLNKKKGALNPGMRCLLHVHVLSVMDY